VTAYLGRYERSWLLHVARLLRGPSRRARTGLALAARHDR